METKDLGIYFKSIIDSDPANVVICNLEHEIIYMNPASVKRYEKWGGKELIGKSLLNCHNQESVDKIYKVIEWFKADIKNNVVHTFYNEKQAKDVYMYALRDENGKLAGYYEKHEYRTKDETPLYAFMSEMNK